MPLTLSPLGMHRVRVIKSVDFGQPPLGGACWVVGSIQPHCRVAAAAGSNAQVAGAALGQRLQNAT